MALKPWLHLFSHLFICMTEKMFVCLAGFLLEIYPGGCLMNGNLFGFSHYVFVACLVRRVNSLE